jgi:uncharacterized hydrophobic protein (TIGR00271 family)
MLRKIVLNFSLANEQDSPQTIHDNIMSGIVFKGTNLWILMVAIVMASVGLNVNSTAVIIGAMLISPLMGPIIGMGYGLGTYDFDLVRQSIKNYLFAVVTGLIVSTLYFSISPLNEAHSELLARTAPNIYDVLIAFFGGLAGFIAIVSRYKGNVITGVAIATALMPPLCTAGYGLATGKWNFFGGALYLLAINTVFIALSALITTRFFGQPLIQQTDPHKKQLANRYVSIIVILTLVPSLVLGMAFITQDQFNRQVKGFISNIKVENNYLLKYEVSPSRKQINLIFGGIGLSETQKDELEQLLKAQGIVAELNFQQGFSFSQIGDINIQTELLRKELSHLREDITKIKQQSAPNANNTLAQTLLLELQSLYPQVSSISLANTEQSSLTTAIPQRIMLIQLNKTPNSISLTALNTWARQRLQDQTITVVIIPKTAENL